MVRIDVHYEGDLHCRAVHEPSATELESDAPRDNQGRGESFSPTDLLATSLGTCMLTVMGIVARKHDWKIEGAKATVVKHMTSVPVRRIAKLEVEIAMPAGLDARARETLERTALTCPVFQSLNPEIEIPVRFAWDS